MSAPLVSVILPCYNVEPYLREALDSLLGQTYSRLEIVALDDGSEDRTAALLDEAAHQDPRVRVLRNPENLGLIRTLNRGVAESRGDFIARMDADDISAPRRLERQMDFLRNRRDVDVVGSAVQLLDEEGHLLRRPPPRATEPEDLPFLSLFATPVAHASILARAPVLRTSPYRDEPGCLHAEDYDLFARMVERGIRLAILDEVLYRLRVRGGSVSVQFEERQVGNFAALGRDHLERMLGLRPEAAVHRVALNRRVPEASGRELREGIALVRLIERTWLAKEDPGPRARRAVGEIAAQQRWDILLQAVLKARPTTRAQALAMLPGEMSSLAFPGVRAYLAAKLGRRPAR